MSNELNSNQPLSNGGSFAERLSKTIDKWAGKPVRRNAGRVVFGVCGAIAQATGFNVAAVRIITAVLMLVLTPVTLVLYLGAYLVIPSGR